MPARRKTTIPANERRLSARAAAHASWAATVDRTQRTAAARRAFQQDHFENAVDPERKLDPADRARRAASARKAHFASLALKSAQARRRKKAAARLTGESKSSMRARPEGVGMKP